MTLADYEMVANPRTGRVDEWLSTYSEEDQAYIGSIVRNGNVADFWRFLNKTGDAPCSLSRFRERLREIYG